MISIQQLPAENIILTGEAKVQAWNHRADPNTQCLIATGVQTCVAMTVFDRENHVGAVAHFDSPNGVRQSIDTLQDKFSQIGGGELRGTEIQFFGGDSRLNLCLSSASIWEAIKTNLKNHYVDVSRIPHAHFTWLLCKPNNYDVMLDLDKGKIKVIVNNSSLSEVLMRKVLLSSRERSSRLSTRMQTNPHLNNQPLYFLGTS